MFAILCLVLSIVFIVVATAKWKMHPFLALLLASFLFGILTGLPLDQLVSAVNEGFGGTLKSIGIVIICGTIIGTFLEKTGGAQSLADGALKITGKKNVPLAMGIVGYIVSMPVFCDSGFVILSPLNKALSKTAKISLAGGAIALSLGLYATHTMVPPTPGPVAAAGILGADLGYVIGIGALVSVVALLASWLFAVLVASKTYISPEDDMLVDTVPEKTTPAEKRPGMLKSLLPIAFPLVLIVISSVCKLTIELEKGADPGMILKVIYFLGQPAVALLLGVGMAMLLPEKLNSEMISGNGWIGHAILASASILVITGAGGAFGQVLRTSGIAEQLGNSMKDMNLGIWLPFIIAAAIKTAQGSSTVAIITTAGLMAPMLEPMGLTGNMSKALVVVAIGAGSMVVSHANDSYFWVVTQFSNMSLKQGFKLQSLGTLIEGTVAAFTVWIISLFAI
jgi:GntP family gluconate:H+ symporter